MDSTPKYLKLPRTPEKFCPFQREFDLKNRRFWCAIADCQGASFCSYIYKSKLPKKGCDIANTAGKLVRGLGSTEYAFVDCMANPGEKAKYRVRYLDHRPRDSDVADAITADTQDFLNSILSRIDVHIYFH